MAKGDIRLHPEHGLAPTLTMCWFCGEATNEIALLGIKADRIMREVHGERYRGSSAQRIPSQSLCDRCESHLKEGAVGLIDKESGARVMLSAQGAERFLDAYEEFKGKICYADPKVVKMFLEAEVVDDES